MLEDDITPQEIEEDGRGVLVAACSENQWAGIIGQLKEALELFTLEASLVVSSLAST